MTINEYGEMQAQEWLERVEVADCDTSDCNHDCANCPDLPESLREQAE